MKLKDVIENFFRGKDCHRGKSNGILEVRGGVLYSGVSIHSSINKDILAYFIGEGKIVVKGLLLSSIFKRHHKILTKVLRDKGYYILYIEKDDRTTIWSHKMDETFYLEKFRKILKNS